MKTQWNSKRSVWGWGIKELTEREKEIELNDAAEDGEELIYCASGVTDGQVRYNKDRGVLSFYAASNDGNLGGWLTTDDFTTETLVNIINALDSILYKRREIPKMAKRFESLETYLPWACEFILKADARDVFGNHDRVLCELLNAVEDKLIDWRELTLAQHIVNTAYALRKETIKNGRVG